jgi:hypothetical protein
MTTAMPGKANNARNESPPRTYPPSWVDHLTGWVARRKWQSWYFYFGLWLVLVAIQLAVLWVEGIYPVGRIFPAQLFIPAMIALFLGMIHFLDRGAEAALETLRPALTATDEEYDQLRYQLTTMPSWPTILASLATIAVILLIGLFTGEGESSIEVLAASPIAMNLLSAAYYIGWWVFGAFLYHTFHQLTVINSLYADYTRVNLFAMSPLYAFSSVTALTAAILAISTYGWTTLNPDNLSDPISIVLVALITLFALTVFAWPLLGTRRILARDKAQWLDQVSLRYEVIYLELHQRIDQAKFDEIEELAKVISVLDTELDTLRDISTWPWQPDTLRYLMTALLLPLLLWIIQYVLQQFLGS